MENTKIFRCSALDGGAPARKGARAENPFHSLENLVNPSSREHLIMVSPYERPSLRTDSEGGGGYSQGTPNGGAQETTLLLCQQTITELI